MGTGYLNVKWGRRGTISRGRWCMLGKGSGVKSQEDYWKWWDQEDYELKGLVGSGGFDVVEEAESVAVAES